MLKGTWQVTPTAESSTPHITIDKFITRQLSARRSRQPQTKEAAVFLRESYHSHCHCTISGGGLLIALAFRVLKRSKRRRTGSERGAWIRLSLLL